MTTRTSPEATLEHLYSPAEYNQTSFHVEFEDDDLLPESLSEPTETYLYAMVGDRYFSCDPSGEPLLNAYELVPASDEQAQAIAELFATEESKTLEMFYESTDEGEIWSIQTYTLAGYNEFGQPLFTITSSTEMREPSEESLETEEFDDSDQPIEMVEPASDNIPPTDSLDGSSVNLEPAIKTEVANTLVLPVETTKTPIDNYFDGAPETTINIVAIDPVDEPPEIPAAEKPTDTSAITKIDKAETGALIINESMTTDLIATSQTVEVPEVIDIIDIKEEAIVESAKVDVPDEVVINETEQTAATPSSTPLENRSTKPTALDTAFTIEHTPQPDESVVSDSQPNIKSEAEPAVIVSESALMPEKVLIEDKIVYLRRSATTEPAQHFHASESAIETVIIGSQTITPKIAAVKEEIVTLKAAPEVTPDKPVARRNIDIRGKADQETHTDTITFDAEPTPESQATHLRRSKIAPMKSFDRLRLRTQPSGITTTADFGEEIATDDFVVTFRPRRKTVRNLRLAVEATA